MSDTGLRRLRMGLETLLGGRAQGFFSPYRYADQMDVPTGYSALERRFESAEPSMSKVLDQIDVDADELAALNGPAPLPRWGSSWFPRLDGAAACAIVRSERPGTIIEVGSGHSTRMLAYAANSGTSITCIDPEPRAALPPDVDWQARVLSEADVPLFCDLNSGDIAFFDSSHILWPGSDVDLILNRILPVLRPGVIVHIHDILLPDPYPDTWAWRGYTEQNGVVGWLFGAFEIVFSSHYALTRMQAAQRRGVSAIPLAKDALETSLWLRRVASH